MMPMSIATGYYSKEAEALENKDLDRIQRILRVLGDGATSQDSTMERVEIPYYAGMDAVEVCESRAQLEEDNISTITKQHIRVLDTSNSLTGTY
ncbi:hypothetical protein AMTR_s00025p00248020 [Amborella trichopoda]|uniref:Uncharacterized protein n=1 Tax=Amborella trichopoda TaxID=13333 RepID=W1PXT0_AMBTC|nr:hypothetical protein AMTR_s00025p00248020 [Amborella trichopoda]